MSQMSPHSNKVDSERSLKVIKNSHYLDFNDDEIMNRAPKSFT